VTSDLTNSAPRVEVHVDRHKATAAGLSEASIGQAVAATFNGAPLGQLTLDGIQQTLVLRLGTAPSSVDTRTALPVAAGVTLGGVATVSTVDGPVQVSRIDGQRAVTVSGTATGSNIGATTSDPTRSASSASPWRPRSRSCSWSWRPRSAASSSH
jgi:hydrophobic/amphiphilic exporter-1 (mainly G- bacteria), HAE1 family